MAEKTNKCIKCGFENKLDAAECTHCGAGLEGILGDTTATFVSPSQVEAKETEIDVGSILEGEEAVLVVKKGPIVGQRLPVNPGETLIGRDPKSDIFLNDITVSRRHAKLTFSPDSNIIIKDVGSLNGTYVNSQRAEEVELKNGDEVQIGKFVLVFLTK